MYIVETATFRLAAGADEAEFLEADRHAQTEFFPRLSGLMRRTTARGPEGEWLVVVLWRSEAEAEAAQRLSADHPAALAFMSLVDQASYGLRRYKTLD